MEFGGRKRSEAKFDRRESYKNYSQNPDIQEKFLNRIVSTDLEGLKKEDKIKMESKPLNELPEPPKFSGDIKLYKSKIEKSVDIYTLLLENIFH